MKWQPAQLKTSLSINEVHVWRVNLDQFTTQEAYLNEIEKERLETMPIALYRQRFINARGILRKLLAHYLHCKPQAIKLSTSLRGKLYLQDDTSKLFFNLTHSKHMAVYAFNYQHEIGIDIEIEHALKNMSGIAERMFSPTELDYLYHEKDPTLQQKKFFTLWTRKEALVKATGEGLSAPVKNITTTLINGMLNPNIEYAKSLGLKLIALPPIEKFSAALAVNKEILNYHYCTLNED